MTTPLHYRPDAPSRADLERGQGLTLLEFGVDWCGHCRAAQAGVAEAMAAHPAVRHLRIEDGPDRALGRSFGVTLWPTLVLLVDGREQGRLVRPTEAAAVLATLRRGDPIPG